MTQVIVFTNSNGGVSVCTPSGELPIEAVLAKDCPAGAFIINADALPQEPDFFDAFVIINNDTVTVDLERAKEVTRARLRRERAPLLEQHDVLYMRALEAGLPTASIVNEKQRLRDLPSLADSCTTLDQLRSLRA